MGVKLESIPAIAPVFDQSQSGDRVWALTALLSVFPSTVQNANSITQHAYTLLCTQPIMLSTHTGGFSLGDLP